MSESPRLFSQEEIDQISTTRTLSAAQLIKGGARYLNDVLVLADNQIEAIQQEYERTSIDIGVVALYDELEAKASVPLDQLINEETNRAKLQDGIAAVTSPYAGIFDDKIPQRDSSKGSLFSKRRAKARKAPTWNIEKIIGTNELRYTFDLEYLEGEEINTIQGVGIQLWEKSVRSGEFDMYHTPRIDVQYNKGSFRSISLRSYDEKDQVSKDLVSMGRGRPIEEPLVEFLYGVTREGKITVDTGYGSPFIKVDCAGGGVEYRYDASSDTFILIGLRHFQRRDVGGLVNVNRPESISTEEYLGILNSMLKLIPTRRVD